MFVLPSDLLRRIAAIIISVVELRVPPEVIRVKQEWVVKEKMAYNIEVINPSHADKPVDILFTEFVLDSRPTFRRVPSG
jgi:hypothetical protein